MTSTFLTWPNELLSSDSGWRLGGPHTISGSLAYSSLRYAHYIVTIANDPSLSLPLDGDGGIAAPKKNIVHDYAIPGGVWGFFSLSFYLWSKTVASH